MWDEEIDGEFDKVHKSQPVNLEINTLRAIRTKFCHVRATHVASLSHMPPICVQTEEEIQALALPDTLTDGEWVSLRTKLL